MEHSNEITAILAEKKFLRVQSAQSFEEFEDSVFDFLKVLNAVDRIVSGDAASPIYIRLLRLLEVQPELVELVADFKVFLKEFMALDKNTATLGLNGAYDQYLNKGLSVGPIVAVALDVLWTLIQDYVHGKEIVEYAIRSKEDKEKLLKGERVFPRLLN